MTIKQKSKRFGVFCYTALLPPQMTDACSVNGDEITSELRREENGIKKVLVNRGVADTVDGPTTDIINCSSWLRASSFI